MEYIWTAEVDRILSRGISLESEGIRNWAMTEPLAISAINEIAELGIPILGGDIYVSNIGRLQLTYDNWYCNKRDSENFNEYVARSQQTAISYIRKYAKPTILFAIVPGV